MDQSDCANAQRCLELVAEQGSLARYIWRFEPAALAAPVMGTGTGASQALSKDLKKRGWKFVGPTTMYAFMQAMGLVNDHQHDCHVRAEIEALRRARA